MLTIHWDSQENTSSKLNQCLKDLQTFFTRSEIGFPDLPQRKELWVQSQELGQIMARNFKSMVLVGIGGSSLGVRVLSEVFHKNNVYYLDNVDACEFESLMKNCDLYSTAWVFASKSGTTIETLCCLEFVQQFYKKQNENFKDKFFVVTEKK